MNEIIGNAFFYDRKLFVFFHVVVCEYSRASILIIAVLKVGITLYNIRDSTVRKYFSKAFT